MTVNLLTDLLTAPIAETTLVQSGVGTEQIESDGKLEERVTYCFQPLQVDEIVGIRHGERAKDLGYGGSCSRNNEDKM